MATNIWDKMQALNTPILSSAMHDIYNEINNIFVLCECTLLDCNCMSEKQKDEAISDFFAIIKKTKARQFLFNNIWSQKLFTPKDFEIHVGCLNNIRYTINTPLPLSFLCIVFLLSDNQHPISITEDKITLIPKRKFADYLQSKMPPHNNKSIEEYFLEQCEYIQEEQNNTYLCNLFLLNIKQYKFNYTIKEEIEPALSKIVIIYGNLNQNIVNYK